MFILPNSSRLTRVLITEFLLVFGLVFLCQGLFNREALAQDFRMYTTVKAVSPGTDGVRKGEEPPKDEILSRSLTFFHAGKVYDYLDGIGELIIFEPGNERFTIVHGKLMKATIVEFPMLNQFLRVADKESQAYLQKLELKEDAQSMRERNLIMFQLNPEFELTHDQSKRMLQLQSKPLSYTVRCENNVKPEFVEAYLNYADWTARLNYVLHSQTLLPGPRLELNKVLRNAKSIPLQVTLKSEEILGLHLTADHKIRWKLDASDRGRITDWERLLNSPELEFHSIHEYQKLLLKMQQLQVNNN